MKSHTPIQLLDSISHHLHIQHHLDHLDHHQAASSPGDHHSNLLCGGHAGEGGWYCGQGVQPDGLNGQVVLVNVLLLLKDVVQVPYLDTPVLVVGRQWRS